MMDSLYLLLPLSVLFVAIIGVAFWWAIFSGQFDDIQNAANTVWADDDNPPPEDDDITGKAKKTGLD